MQPMAQLYYEIPQVNLKKDRLRSTRADMERSWSRVIKGKSKIRTIYYSC